MSYPPVSSHAVDCVPANACHGNVPLTRTPHFCRSHCDSWHIHHRKEPLERNTAWVVAPIQCRHPTVHSRKSGDTASLSSLSLCGLTSLTMAYQALIIVSASTSLGNVKWTDVFCKLKLFDRSHPGVFVNNTVIYLVNNTAYIGNNIKNSATCFGSLEPSSG